ncbi:MAG: YraN family protein [Muribaculaceae bacterium]|nr:YraN family protein [Muribaculaceae bacterium]
MARHNEVGSWGEKAAQEYLLRQGYAIMEQNVVIGKVEIDFVAMKGDRIVFVEVKTRSTSFVDPAEAVDRRKMMRLSRAVDAYIQSRNIQHEPQIDIISIIGTPEASAESVVIEHIPDAFRPPLQSR